MASTSRDRAKAERYESLLRESARLFAERGFTGVSLEELGAAVGVSGPAVYRHVSGKQALLGALLVRVSDDLVTGGTTVAQAALGGIERMRALIRFHVAFALGNADVIRVQDREVPHLADDDYAEVRRLQRAYIALWMQTLAPLIDAPDTALRLRVQAAFGLINSTPHSTSSAARAQASTADLLAAMAEAALLVSE